MRVAESENVLNSIELALLFKILGINKFQFSPNIPDLLSLLVAYVRGYKSAQ